MTTVTLLSRAQVCPHAGASHVMDTPARAAAADSVDADALSYLSANDVRKLAKAYAEMSALGIDTRMVDAMAAILGAQRRAEADADAGHGAGARAAPALIAELSGAIRARAADTSGAVPAPGMAPVPRFGPV